MARPSATRCRSPPDKLRGLARQQMLDAQEPRGFADPLANLAARHALTFERKADVLLNIHMRIKRKQLKDESDVARRGAAEGDVLAVEQYAPVRRKLKAGDHAQRRRLAATRRSEQRKEAAAFDSEIRIRAQP